MAWWVARARRKRCEAERDRSADNLTDAAIDAALTVRSYCAANFDAAGWGRTAIFATGRLLSFLPRPVPSPLCVLSQADKQPHSGSTSSNDVPEASNDSSETQDGPVLGVHTLFYWPAACAAHIRLLMQVCHISRHICRHSHDRKRGQHMHSAFQHLSR